METQKISKTTPVPKNSFKSILAIFLLIITVAFISGGIVYVWQNRKIIYLQQKISFLEIQAKQRLSPPPRLPPPSVLNNPSNMPTPPPISYSFKNPDINITQKEQPFDYTVESLENLATECGTSHQAGYLKNLVEKYFDTQKLIYKFEYQTVDQDDTIYTLTILPNITNYQTLKELKKDFDQCFAGGNAYPMMLNQNWLVFQNSCDTGFDDGSVKTHSCDIIKNEITKNLSLN